MIELNGATLVGRGCRRVVYVHPDAADRCIKLQTPAARAQRHRQKAMVRELHYLAFYERKGRAMDRVSRCFGAVQTSEGEGHVFELIRDHDGTIAPTLEEELRSGRASLAECGAELEDLRAYLRREGIVIADLHAANLVRQEVRSGEFRLVVIDGVGNTEFIKLSDYFRPAARRKVERKWSRFCAELAREWGSGAAGAR